uniref:EB domain-containing protein n=1 Tax=Strigamia maritima TaxID=126957 RepID=T1IX97_STRMM
MYTQICLECRALAPDCESKLNAFCDLPETICDILPLLDANCQSIVWMIFTARYFGQTRAATTRTKIYNGVCSSTFNCKFINGWSDLVCQSNRCICPSNSLPDYLYKRCIKINAKENDSNFTEYKLIIIVAAIVVCVVICACRIIIWVIRFRNSIGLSARHIGATGTSSTPEFVDRANLPPEYSTIFTITSQTRNDEELDKLPTYEEVERHPQKSLKSTYNEICLECRALAPDCESKLNAFCDRPESSCDTLPLLDKNCLRIATTTFTARKFGQTPGVLIISVPATIHLFQIMLEKSVNYHFFSMERTLTTEYVTQQVTASTSLVGQTWYVDQVVAFVQIICNQCTVLNAAYLIYRVLMIQLQIADYNNNNSDDNGNTDDDKLSNSHTYSVMIFVYITLGVCIFFGSCVACFVKMFCRTTSTLVSRETSDLVIIQAETQITLTNHESRPTVTNTNSNLEEHNDLPPNYANKGHNKLPSYEEVATAPEWNSSMEDRNSTTETCGYQLHSNDYATQSSDYHGTSNYESCASNYESCTSNYDSCTGMGAGLSQSCVFLLFFSTTVHIRPSDIHIIPNKTISFLHKLIKPYQITTKSTKNTSKYNIHEVKSAWHQPEELCDCVGRRDGNSPGASPDWHWHRVASFSFPGAPAKTRKCNKSRDCVYTLGELCLEEKCRCEPPACRMLALPYKCTDDVDCAQIISFSHCMHQSCICLPGYRPVALGRACELITIPETSSPSSLYPVRPNPPFRSAGETDYSGVVKMALGAAIVMLAGVILALVWNLYRERRRARRALAGQNMTRNRRPPRTSRRPLRMRGAHPGSDRPDNPPGYDDVFFITTSEPGRRHEKPPSYEEALRDQQIPIVTPPAYLNLGFNSDVPCAAGYYQPVATNGEHSLQGRNTANSSGPTTQTRASTHILNVASIINRLKLNRQPMSTANNSTDSATAEDESPALPTTCTLRRTKSGRAPDDICPVQCENLVDQVSVRRSNSNPIATVRIDQSASQSQSFDTAHVIGDTSINNDSDSSPGAGVTSDSELVSVAAHYKQSKDDEPSADLTVVIDRQT